MVTQGSWKVAKIRIPDIKSGIPTLYWNPDFYLFFRLFRYWGLCRYYERCAQSAVIDGKEHCVYVPFYNYLACSTNIIIQCVLQTDNLGWLQLNSLFLLKQCTQSVDRGERKLWVYAIFQESSMQHKCYHNSFNVCCMQKIFNAKIV